MARWSHCIHGVVDSVSNYVIKWLTLMLLMLNAADDFFPLARFFITWKLWATIMPAAYVHILVLFNEFYVLWLSFASVRVDGACVCGVCMRCVCVRPSYVDDEIGISLRGARVCDVNKSLPMCCMCQSSGFIWFHAVKIFSSVFLVSLSKPWCCFQKFFFFNLNYILLKLKLHSQLKRCSSTVFERFTSSFQRIHFIHFILANLEPNKIH